LDGSIPVLFFAHLIVNHLAYSFHRDTPLCTFVFFSFPFSPPSCIPEVTFEGFFFPSCADDRYARSQLRAFSLSHVLRSQKAFGWQFENLGLCFPFFGAAAIFFLSALSPSFRLGLLLFPSGNVLPIRVKSSPHCTPTVVPILVHVDIFTFFFVYFYYPPPAPLSPHPACFLSNLSTAPLCFLPLFFVNFFGVAPRYDRILFVCAEFPFHSFSFPQFCFF